MSFTHKLLTALLLASFFASAGYAQVGRSSNRLSDTEAAAQKTANEPVIVQDPFASKGRVMDLLDVAPKHKTPSNAFSEVPMRAEGFAGRLSATPRPTTFKLVEWESDSFLYRRLMFEEPIVERHGLANSEMQQSLQSAGTFFLRGALLPFALVTKRHKGCESAEGWDIQQGAPLGKPACRPLGR